ARYPWELLHDGAHFLLTDPAFNLVRSVPFAGPAALPLESAPAAAARPPHLIEMLLAECLLDKTPALLAEYDTLQTALDPALRAHRLDLAYLMPPTWDSLMDWLLAGAPDVLHLAGHSIASGSEAGNLAESGVMFEAASGGSDAVAARHVGEALFSTRLQLLLLSATSAAKTPGESGWGGVAPALIASGIPAVIAMQQTMPPAALQRFVRGFYAALLAGHSIETAIRLGRKQLARTTQWHIPALIVRAPDISAAADPEAGTISPALKTIWLDTAAPQQVTRHDSFRLGVWVRTQNAPASAPPTAESVRRLIGYPLDTQLPVPAEQAAESCPVREPLQPGLVTIRVRAPGAEVHVRQRTTALGLDTVLPPVWFPITPRQTGVLALQIEVVQGDCVITTVTHTIRVAHDLAQTGAISTSARVRSWRFPARPHRQSGEFDSVADLLPDQTADSVAYAPSLPPDESGGDKGDGSTLLLHDDTFAAEIKTEPERELWRDHEHKPREREKDRRRVRESELSTPDPDQLEELDGVLDMLQAGEQPVREKDDPRIGSDEFEQSDSAPDALPLDDLIVPSLEELFSLEDQDRTLAGGNWAGSGLDDVQVMPRPDAPTFDEAMIEPTLIGGATLDHAPADRADDNADLGDGPTLILSDPTPDDPAPPPITDEEWLDWLQNWQGDD
ncbi:MAG: CHAT domain-containing protein, partial [Anaerolineae bacterium]|nr:CHAT domain-containing protein [Anaerolineae bacterium]